MHLPDQTLSNFAVALTHAARAYRAAACKITANYGLSQSTVLPVLVISRFGKTGVRPGVLAETLSLEPAFAGTGCRPSDRRRPGRAP
jgi:MarR family transcriptional regulator for hemolysin